MTNTGESLLMTPHATTRLFYMETTDSLTMPAKIFASETKEGNRGRVSCFPSKVTNRLKNTLNDIIGNTHSTSGGGEPRGEEEEEEGGGGGAYHWDDVRECVWEESTAIGRGGSKQR
jgi:hypothetical protein